MGVSLHYATAQSVAFEVRELVKREADDISRARDWWTEPIHFFETAWQPGCLVGNSKLFRPGFDWGDDTFLAWRDTQFIIASLAKWASDFGLTWLLSSEGEIGIVDAKGADDRVNEFFSRLVALGRHPTSDQHAVDILAADLLKKYSARNG
jgi:hypothetical protein